jgi:serine O-acetyltransferase
MAFNFIKEIDWEATAKELVGFASRKATELGKKGARLAVDTATDAAKRLKKLAAAIEKEVKDDIEAVKQRDPAAKNGIEILLLYSGVHAIFAYRVAHKLYLGKHFFSARLVSQLAKFFTGIEIHPGATIGKGLFIDHGTGVVIGETAEIGDNCTLYQGVTLGGTGKDVGKRHPTLGSGVMVGSGAKVLGPFKIGDNSKIASNAVVLDEIPPDSTAVGIPARVVKRGGRKVDNMDQIHIPDPVSQELCRLEHRIAMLEKELKEKE